MIASYLARSEYRAWLMSASDWLAVLVMVTLPWSTSATAIFIALWTVAVLPTLDWPIVREHLRRAALYLPLLICAFLLLGMLWADVAWAERWAGVRHLVKLVLLPLIIIHFSRSERALWTFNAFLVSCAVLLLYSWASFRWPSLVWGGRLPGIPTKDYIYQNVFFALAACMLLHVSITCFREGRNVYAVLAALLVLLFVANMAYVATSRSAIIALPIMLALVGYQRFGIRGVLPILAGFVVFANLAWMTSPHLRERVSLAIHGTVQAQPDMQAGAAISERLRLAFWRGSVAAIADEPILGHGTGSIRDVLVKATSGEEAEKAAGLANPHNQVLAIGIQLGVPGIAVLFLMWLSHLFLFVGNSWPARCGALIVVQNVINSAFNSHLTDFTAGWLYVFGVGILAGTLMRERSRAFVTEAEPVQRSFQSGKDILPA